MKNFISIDVEDYHHVFGNYDDVKLQSHFFDEKFSCVEKGCFKFLEKLENKKKKATFFFLGSISNKYKSLIKEIVNNGHEIGSHGFNHIPINLISTNDFKNDLIKSKKILEDLSQFKLISYRAPGFSLTKNQKQIYNILR